MMKINKEIPHFLIAVGCSLISILLTVLYSLARLGLENDWLEYIRVLGASLFFLNAFAFVPSTYRSLNFGSFFNIFMLLIIAVVFFILQEVNIFFWALPIMGLISFLLHLRSLIYHSEFGKDILISVIVTVSVIVMSVFLFGIYYSNHLNPYYIENLVNGGSVDTLYHISIAQMIKNYQSITTGLDGLQFMHYHFGSHLILGSLSKAIGISVIDFYQIAFPIIFFPLLIQSILSFSTDLSTIGDSKINRNQVIIIIVILLSGLIGFTNNDGVHKLSMRSLVGWNLIYTSESYSMSVMLTLSLGCLIVYAIKNKSAKGNGYLKSSVLGISVFTLFIAISICKISSGFLLFCLAQYFFVRLEAYKKLALIILNIVFILISVCLYVLMNDPYDPEGNNGQYFQMLTSLVKAPILTFFLLHFFWSWLVIVFQLISLKIYNLKDLVSQFRQRKTLLSEISIILSICGLIPGNVLTFSDRNGVYFSEFQSWISLCFVVHICVSKGIDSKFLKDLIEKNRILIIALLSTVYLQSIYNQWIDPLAFYAFFPFIILFFAPSLNKIEYRLRAILLIIVFVPLVSVIFHNTQASYAASNNKMSSVKKQLLGISYNRNDSNKYIASSTNTIEYQRKDSLNLVTKMLLTLDKMTEGEKKLSIAFVRSNNNYLKVFPCWGVPFIVPALTGLVQYRGLKGADECNHSYLGLEHYKKYVSSELDSSLSAQDLVNIKNQGFRRVYILDLDKGKYQIKFLE
jgi:hypothetical protein